MKRNTNAHREWSTWLIAAAGMFEGLKALIPVVQDYLPAMVVDWTGLVLAAAALVARFIAQGLKG